MAGDAAWFSPVLMNHDALPTLLHPLPMDHPERVDYVADEAPFAVHDEFLGGAKRDFPRNMTNLDIPGSKPRYQIKDPLDPMMYFKAEQLPDACRRHGGETIPFTGDVNYEGLRQSLETFGLKFSDAEYSRLLRIVDKEGRGKVRYRDLANSLRHCDGYYPYYGHWVVLSKIVLFQSI